MLVGIGDGLGEGDGDGDGLGEGDGERCGDGEALGDAEGLGDTDGLAEAETAGDGEGLAAGVYAPRTAKTAATFAPSVNGVPFDANVNVVPETVAGAAQVSFHVCSTGS